MEILGDVPHDVKTDAIGSYSFISPLLVSGFNYRPHSIEPQPIRIVCLDSEIRNLFLMPEVPEQN